MFVPLTPGVCYFCSTPSRIMKVDWLLGFPCCLPLSFPFAGSLAFLAQSCCVWAPICQAVINSKKNPFLLNYFRNVLQTCLNDVATSSALRSSFDFRLIQVEKGKRESRASHTEVYPSFLGQGVGLLVGWLVPIPFIQRLWLLVSILTIKIPSHNLITKGRRTIHKNSKHALGMLKYTEGNLSNWVL